MIFDSWFKKRFEKLLWKMLDGMGHSLTFKEKDKIVRITSNIYSFIIMVGMFMFLIYFFSSMVFYRAGFERTVIILLSIIMLRMMKS